MVRFWPRAGHQTEELAVSSALPLAPLPTPCAPGAARDGQQAHEQHASLPHRHAWNESRMEAGEDRQPRQALSLDVKEAGSSGKQAGGEAAAPAGAPGAPYRASVAKEDAPRYIT